MKKLLACLNILILCFIIAGCADTGTSGEISTPSVSVTPQVTVTPEIVTPTPYPSPETTPYRVLSDYMGDYVISVNRLQNKVFVFGRDEENKYTKLVKAFICSVGTGPGDNETPLGIFFTNEKYIWRALYGGTYGQYAIRFYGAYLFHSVPYTKKDKSALKSEEFNKLGTAASQGCIRLTVEDAKWLYDNCRKGTLVYIYDSDKIEPFVESVQKIDLTDPKAVWDPTDPDMNNPWKA